MSSPVPPPAFYASRRGVFGDWWTILHPPYTAWHLSYVVIGAALAPVVDGGVLLATLLAFFAAVGVSAHALDELHGRPLRTHLSDRTLVIASVAGLVIAVGLGVLGVVRVGWWLLPFVVIGPLLVAGYNLELFGGRLHTDLAFALAWGAFPFLTGYVAQSDTLRAAPVIGAGAATLLSLAQRSLSTPARFVRRRAVTVEGTMVDKDGAKQTIDAQSVLSPLEHALKYLAYGVTALAIAFAVARLT
jgi:hypothetical protein